MNIRYSGFFLLPLNILTTFLTTLDPDKVRFIPIFQNSKNPKPLENTSFSRGFVGGEGEI